MTVGASDGMTGCGSVFKTRREAGRKGVEASAGPIASAAPDISVGFRVPVRRQLLFTPLFQGGCRGGAYRFIEPQSSLPASHMATGHGRRRIMAAFATVPFFDGRRKDMIYFGVCAPRIKRRPSRACRAGRSAWKDKRSCRARAGRSAGQPRGGTSSRLRGEESPAEAIG